MLEAFLSESDMFSNSQDVNNRISFFFLIYLVSKEAPDFYQKTISTSLEGIGFLIIIFGENMEYYNHKKE